MRSLDPVDRLGTAAADDVSTWLVYGAVETLIELRLGPVKREVATVIAALESLALEVGSILREVVADARQAGHSWEEIATWLTADASVALRRYGPDAGDAVGPNSVSSLDRHD